MTEVRPVFLLSPAYCGGRRATYLMRPGSTLALAARLQAGTLTLGEAFTFMSGLYFRGKLSYAMAFGWPPNPAHVITPTRGLMSPTTPIGLDLLHEFAAVDVDAGDERYRLPLEASLCTLLQELASSAPVILLGSIATGKYVDVLTAALGARLHFPSAFVGRGDMSRGGLLLRAAAAGEELAYAPLSSHTARHGERPPKLPPLRPGVNARL